MSHRLLRSRSPYVYVICSDGHVGSVPPVSLLLGLAYLVEGQHIRRRYEYVVFVLFLNCKHFQSGDFLGAWLCHCY